MIFSGLLTIALVLLMVYALLQKRHFPLIAKALPIVCAFGIYVAWFPERTTAWAAAVGVGRGVDLMLYVWMLASSLLFLVLQLKFARQDRKITELTRALALARAAPPGSRPDEWRWSGPPPLPVASGQARQASTRRGPQPRGRARLRPLE